MGFLSPSPPDPEETASAQTATNIGTAIANRQLNNVNQSGPLGSIRYDQTGTYQFTDPLNDNAIYDIPTFTQVTELTPEGQQIQDANNQTQINLAGIGQDLSGSIRNHLARSQSYENLPGRARASTLSTGLPQGGDAASLQTSDATRQRVEQALMSRINPQLEDDRQTLRAELAQQGIRRGSEAYTRAMEDFGENVNDARFGAILGAGEEASRDFAINLGRFNTLEGQRAARFGENNQIYGAQASDRARAISERTNRRNQPLNEIAALLSGSQVQSPSLNPTPQSNIPTVDYAALVANNFQARQAQSNQLLGGLFGLGAAGITGFA